MDPNDPNQPQPVPGQPQQPTEPQTPTEPETPSMPEPTTPVEDDNQGGGGMPPTQG